MRDLLGDNFGEGEYSKLLFEFRLPLADTKDVYRVNERLFVAKVDGSLKIVIALDSGSSLLASIS